MSFIFNTLDSNTPNTALNQSYFEVEDQLQTAPPALKKLGSAIVIGLALSAATTMDVPSYIRIQGIQRSSSNRAPLFGIGSFVNSQPFATYAEQLDTPPLPESVLSSLLTAGVNISRATAIITAAQSSLFSMGFPVIAVEGNTLYDPEEETTHVMINLIISATFDQALEIDSKLSRVIVKSFANIPQALSISVQEMI